MKEFTFKSQNCSDTVFLRSDSNILLQRLFGLPCAFYSSGEDPASGRGLFTIRTDMARFEGKDFILKNSSFKRDEFQASWQLGKSSLEIETQWVFCPETGIWSRKDRLYNNSEEDIVVLQALSCFAFSPADYRMYSQDSVWCNESQGGWQRLSNANMVLKSEGGRTCLNSAPYMCLQDINSQENIIFHVLPRGNWTVRINAVPAGGNSRPFTVVELGQADEDLRLVLLTGESFAFPEIIFQAVVGAEPADAAPCLHKYLLKSQSGTAGKETPVVYNTWFDDFEHLRIERLRKQLKTAQTIGCEVFVVDAGWYGCGEGDWSAQAGDWREKENSAFYNKMADFAEEVRATGLGFGLWMEPERVGSQTPIRMEHPDWFIPGKNSNFFYPDLTQDDVYKYISSEISRLIKTYQLTWLKVDFNFELGRDLSGQEFSTHYQRWYCLLDELRQEYPETFFEGCASGGMRLDLNTLSHFDGHFLSDTVNPVDVIRIYQSSILRSLPGRVTKWVVLRSVGRTIPQYGRNLNDAAEHLVTPCGATWEKSETVSVDFAARVVLPGIFGISGDIASLPEKACVRLRHHVEFFKKWRSFLYGSVAHLLTSPALKENRRGWIGIQLQTPTDTTSLLFIYRLNNGDNKRQFSLRGLENDRIYSVTDDNYPDRQPELITGEQLMNSGLTVKLPGENQTAVFVIA